ncbi:MAG: fumarate hydratase [Methanolinea sp.]|nr:fumarate hydratase [Methanolinea sp.]
MIPSPDPALYEGLTRATCAALEQAEIFLPPDVVRALTAARDRETNGIAQREIDTILANIAMAESLRVPICQDTGVPVIYLTLPPGIPLDPRIFDAVAEGVRIATRKIPLRPNVVDPLTRKNSGDNTGPGMPAVHVRTGEKVTVTVLPKGAGAENMSRIAMMLPTDRDKVPKFVAETVLLAGGKPCPPVVLGIGIGGTFDGAAALAKEALLEPLDTMTSAEHEILDAVNDLCIGPMGLGGRTTALAVKIREAACHTASLPVAVNVQCWACRRATVEVQW